VKAPLVGCRETLTSGALHSEILDRIPCSFLFAVMCPISRHPVQGVGVSGPAEGWLVPGIRLFLSCPWNLRRSG
jgi:hypothetical protein